MPSVGLHHDTPSQEVVLYPRLRVFASHWRFRRSMSETKPISRCLLRPRLSAAISPLSPPVVDYDCLY
jgi:hypothetical protein